MYLVMWQSLHGLNVCTHHMKCLKAISISRTNIWNSFSKMTCMIVTAIQLENCCMNTSGRQRSMNGQNNPPDLTHFRFYIWGPLRTCCTVKHLQKWTVTACSKNTTHHIKFMLFSWTGKNICTFVSSWTMDILSIFCNSWHTMIEILMVSDLWGHSVHFYSFGWKSGYEPYMAQELIFFAYLFMYLSYFWFTGNVFIYFLLSVMRVVCLILWVLCNSL